MWQSLVAVGRGTTEITPWQMAMNKNKKKKKETTAAKHNSSDTPIGGRRHKL